MPGQILSQAPKSICVLRLSAIGDVCHAVAMVQAIRATWPDVAITWVLGKVEAKLLDGLEGVELVVFDKRAGLRGYRELRHSLRGRRFDVLLHMQVALRASFASLCISAKVKVGFDRARAKEGQWLFTNATIQPQRAPHVLDGFMGFAQAIGVNNISPRWVMPLGLDHESWLQQQSFVASPYAIIAPAASKAERNWTVAGYRDARDYLIKKGFHVVVCGGPSDTELNLAQQIVAGAEQSVTNMAGKTDLKQLLVMIRSAQLLIAPDTGPAHMAVTVGTPVIGLYAHSNPGRTGPYTYQKYTVSVYEAMVQQQFGQPASALPWGTRAKGEGLMNAIEKDVVRSRIDALLHDFYRDSISEA